MANRISLAKLHIHKGLSEETIAFDADVMLDGEKIGTATCRGHGDQALVRTRIAYASLDTIARAETPSANRIESYRSYGLETAFKSIEDVVEALVADECDRRETERLAKRIAKRMLTATYFRTPGGTVRTLNIVGDRAEALINAKYPGATILNKLPINEAVRAMGGA
ncbi:MAG: hypothetical protein KAX77_01225 [Xanthomonadales bacterium]|nr:hypothetical protein [Xanthomonadales bacterium]